MAEINAWIYPHTNNSMVVRFPGKDFTGHDVELRLSAFGRQIGVLSTVDGSLSLSLPDGIGIPTTEELLALAPAGKVTKVDAIDIVGESRQKFAAGTLAKGGPGEFEGLQISLVEVPGIQGYPGWTPIYSAEPYLTSVVLRVIDWTGGGGEKPPMGLYLGPNGFVDNIGDATLFASVAAANVAVAAAQAFAEQTDADAQAVEMSRQHVADNAAISVNAKDGAQAALNGTVVAAESVGSYTTLAGVVAFSREAIMSTAEFEPAVVIARFGQTPDVVD